MDQFKTKIDELTNILSSYKKEYNEANFEHIDANKYKQAVEAFMFDFERYKDRFKKQASYNLCNFNYKMDDRIVGFFIKNPTMLDKIAEDYFSGSLKMNWSVSTSNDEINLQFIW